MKSEAKRHTTPTRSNKKNLGNKLYYVIASLSIFLWAIYPTIIKFVVSNIHISLLLFSRFLVSSIILSWLLPKVIKKLPLISKKFIFFFWLNITLLFISQTLAIDYLSVTTYIIVFTLTPLVSLLLIKYRFSLISWAGISLAIIGSILFLFPAISSHPIHESNYFAVACMCVGMLTWVFYTLMTKKLHSILNDLEIIALTSYLALISNALFWGIDGFSVTGLSASVATANIFAGIFMPLALVCFSIGLRYVPAFTISAQYFEPIFGVFFACLFLHETLQGMEIIGALCVILGVGFISRRT